MRLMESGEMYLESLLILTQQKGHVRAVDISEYMGFSKPSISRGISLLKEGGYVAADEDGFLILTESGKQVAEKIYERHRLLTQYLIRLGVDEKIAAEDACKIEHHISDESFSAIKRHAKEMLSGDK